MIQREGSSIAIKTWITTRVTAARCHLLGSVSTLCLIFGILWIGKATWQDASSIEMNGISVDLTDAVLITASAEQWRRQSTIASEQSKHIDGRVAAIQQWLPVKVQWERLQQHFQQSANEFELKTTSIRKGSVHLGDRTGVLVATCDIEGNYANLCNFLHQLSVQPNPVACSELRLQRSAGNSDNMSQAGEPECRATLTLRIPYAAESSYSGRLLLSGDSHES